MARAKKDKGTPLPLETRDEVLVKALDRMNSIKEEAAVANSRASAMRRELKEQGISARAATVGCAIRVLEEGPARDAETRALLVVLRAANDNTRALAAEILGLDAAAQSPRQETRPLWEDDEMGDDEFDDDTDIDDCKDEVGQTTTRTETEEEAPQSEWAEPVPEATDDDLDEAGQFYNAGRAAAIAGKMSGENPYDGRTTAGRMWAKGFASAVNVAGHPDDGENPLDIPQFLARERPTTSGVVPFPATQAVG